MNPFWRTNQRLARILIIVACLSIIFCTVAAYQNPIIDYNLDILSNLPSLFIPVLCLSFLSVMTSMFLVYRDDTKEHRTIMWIGLALLITISAVVILLPFLRSCWFYGRSDDTLAQIGLLEYVVEYGKISSPYPLLHIISAEIDMSSGIGQFYSSTIVANLIILAALPSYYILAKKIFKDRLSIAICMAVAVTISFGIPTLKPYYTSVALIPIILVIYLNRNDGVKYRLLNLLMIVFIALVHPLIGIFVFLGFVFTELFMNRFHIIKTIRINLRAGTLQLILIGFVAMLSWMFFQFPNLVSEPILRVNQFLFSDIRIEQSNTILYQLNFYGLNTFDFITLAIIDYGITIILCVLSVAAIILIFRNRKTASSQNRDLLVIVSFFLFTILFVGLSLVFIRAINTGVTRFFTLPLVCTPILVTYFVKRVCLPSKARMVAFMTVMVVAFALVVPATHPTPASFVMSQEVTVSEINGESWLYNTTNQTSIIGTSGERLQDYVPNQWIVP